MTSTTVKQLRLGDVVLAHGMRCEVVDPPQHSRSHSDDHGGVFYTSAVVLNRDEIPPHHVPLGFTPRDDQGRARWTLQGNDLYRLALEDA